MRILLLSGSGIMKTELPRSIEGSFWVENTLTSNNMVCVDGVDNRWIMKSNDEYKIVINEKKTEELELKAGLTGIIDGNNEKIFFYVEDYCDNSYTTYSITNSSVTIGSDNTDIVYQSPYVLKKLLSLSFTDNGFNIGLEKDGYLYVNESFVSLNNSQFAYGSELFIFGLRLMVCKNVIIINNPFNLVKINSNLVPVDLKANLGISEEIEENVKEKDYYQDNDYFYKKARLRKFINTYKLNVSNPPAPVKQNETSPLLVLGPMLTMGLISVISFGDVIAAVVRGERTLDDSMTEIITAGATLLCTLFWPNLTSIYEKRRTKVNEKRRQRKYKDYISRKKTEIKEEADKQKQIIMDNLVTVNECSNTILEKKLNLWERRNDQKDFLTVRVGEGNVPVDMEIVFQKTDFVMDEDILQTTAAKALEELKTLYNVPVGFSFNGKKVTAIMGKSDKLFNYVDEILLQLLAFHSYDDLKMVFLTDKKNEGHWKKYKKIPHGFNDNKQIRFFANDPEEYKYVSAYLEEEFVNRAQHLDDSSIQANEDKEKKVYRPYYLIIVDNYPMLRKLGIIEKILKFPESIGFSIVCVENRLSRLPSECVDFITFDDKNSSILCTSIGRYKQQVFVAPELSLVDYEKCYEILSNIPIEFNDSSKFLPTSCGFLEMYGVGKVEQLNTHNRWTMNNPVKSLRAQIGINDEGGPIYLDLHEKYHGPHGLIAGTTGSGKSEFIITYILSLALNYSPNEVAFILIDYKGGGLAGAFENKTLGLRLPHLAGTITNLDKASLNRTLVSINSELQRRQAKFNEERDKLGESTIDIYKYQRLFREGKIKDPMPHLFIISDEFAELKAQQPDFMEDLVSAARIGRSLGIHLILATQKPSGVVDDQIWSNTKFRVCLKVQDSADSNEMLKRPDAATITNAGRFYLQVGNDEIFVLGQSGWAGTQYAPSDTIKKKYDRSVMLIDDVGSVVAKLENLEEKKATTDNGDELGNVLKYICNIAEKDDVKAKNLWVDSIPGEIMAEDIINKYKFIYPDDHIEAVLGEYDAPSKQLENILTLNLSDNGNTLITGILSSNYEMLVSVLIYSLCIHYSPEDLNIYIVDFGSEALRLFNKFQQVGDIVFATDSDKLQKMFIILTNLIADRKKLFAEYNGDFKNYNKNSGKKVPLKLFVLNNYDSFVEEYSSYEDTLLTIARECERYGIVLVVSASKPGSLYGKLLTCFHNNFALNVSDHSDYMDVFNQRVDVYPAEFDGRGVCMIDQPYEFQTAMICDYDKMFEYVSQKAEKVKAAFKEKAPNIPSLPEKVTIPMLTDSIKDIHNIPIGIGKEDIEVVSYDFFHSKANILSTKNIVNCMELLKSIIYGVRKLGNMVVLIDANSELSAIGGTVNNYVDTNLEDFIQKFEEFLDKQIDGKNIKVLCIISGIENFQSSLSEDMFNGFMNGIKSLDNIHLLFADSSYRLKKYAYDDWYSSIVDNSNGIWVGPGYTEQAVIAVQGTGDIGNNKFAMVCKNDEGILTMIPYEEVEDEK